MFDPNCKIFVAGHNGMVGSGILEELYNQGCSNVVTEERGNLDLTDQTAVERFFEKEQFDEVYLAAAKVGGIYANNTYPADFIQINLDIQSNVIRAAYRTKVSKLLFLGSSCIYPREAAQPMHESELLCGKLEPTNEPYAIAKIAGIKLCESYHRQYGCDYRSVMPTNLYGPNDNFNPENSHVIPALLRRFHEAKLNSSPEVVVWGSGTPRREFLYVSDMAKACVQIMNVSREQYNSVTEPMCSHINVGCGRDYTIRELAECVKTVVGYTGVVAFDSAKPDGAPRKLLDVSRANALGWQSEVALEDGLQRAYEWFVDNYSDVRN